MCSVTSVVVEPTVDEFEVSLPIFLGEFRDLQVFIFTNRFNPEGKGAIKSIGSDVVSWNYIREI